MKVPKVSVVMPVHNGERYLRKAMDSILGQSYENLEFLIIDDGSIDGTRVILEYYNDSKIKILRNDRREGLTKALNKAIRIASGEYIARQDADDISMCDRVEKQVNYLERNKEIALLGTAINVIDEKDDNLQDIEYPISHFYIRQTLIKYNCFCHGSVMFRKQCLSELGGYREVFETAQDYDLWLRFSEKYEVANLRDRLYKYRFNPSSLTFRKILNQTRMANFARKLSYVRESGSSECIIMNEVSTNLESPANLSEKRGIVQNYNPWGKLLLKQNRKDEAFLLMSEVFRYHPSTLCRVIFKMTKGWRSSFILERLIKG
jgi:glycosyltransferase involved in cell wall biosynthesis